MSLISENIIKIKEAFVESYTGKSHIQEILPINKTNFLPIEQKHLTLLKMVDMLICLPLKN